MSDYHEELPMAALHDVRKRAALAFCSKLSTDFLSKHTIMPLDDIPKQYATFDQVPGFIGFVPVIKVVDHA